MRILTETDRELERIDRRLPTLKLLYTISRAGGATATDGAQTWVLTPTAKPIGREVDPDQGIPLIADRRASARHAQIQATHEGARIVDLGSKNGTFVNGLAVQESALVDGDVIRIGNSLLLLRYEPAIKQDAPKDALSVHRLLLGRSPAIGKLRQALAQAAPEEQSTVLLLGATGTGKELAAEALHALSSRSKGPLIRVNCSAIPAGLAESMLFGHSERAFNDARQHSGYFQDANGGTLFLDEIGELPLDLQPKLLRALEEHAIYPIGGKHREPNDVRFIAATNRPLSDAVHSGEFRADLYARLNALPIALPLLHERREDILLLFMHFLAQPERLLTARLCEALLLYPWPGNVRDLKNLAEFARTFAKEGPELDLPSLAERLRPPSAPSSATPRDAFPKEATPPAAGDLALDTTAMRRREAYSPEILSRLLAEHRGIVAHVAKRLGLSRRQLGRVLGKFGLDPERFRQADAASFAPAPKDATIARRDAEDAATPGEDDDEDNGGNS